MVVFIVDRDAVGMASDLNGLASRDGLQLRFEACATPERLLQDLKNRTPDLVMLHHNWSGIGVSQLIGRIDVETRGQTRIVVFTGQTVRINELIECIRCGVADYWTKSGYDVAVALRQIAIYCASSNWTISSLKMPSGSLRLLLERAEASTNELEECERLNGVLRAKLQAMESKERERLLGVLFGLVKMIVICTALCAAFLVAEKYTRMGTWATLVLVGIIALCFLLSEGRITSAWIRWTGGAAGVKAAMPNDK
jgi:DNA-binding NarL/FixJ family response regulator